jgi:molybdopterin molybdotransferase
MLHFDESMEIIEKLTIEHYKTRKLNLQESLGCVLAEDIVAGYHSPEYLTSAMDGYAIRCKDQTLGELHITTINPAGTPIDDEVVEGTCIKTFTGSLMPRGADTLIPIEYVKVEGESIVIQQEVACGFSVRAVGENFEKGDVLIKKGTTIDFAHIGVMASLNVVAPLVYEKPHVAILSTGSELLELGETQTTPAQIRSSNNYILEAIVQKYGGTPLQKGCIDDDKESILASMEEALHQSDIVVTTGGVSVGDFDFVKDVVEALGATILFKGVRLKPGQHILVAQKGEKFIVGLPGFAYSATVTALLYVVPLIQKLQQGKQRLTKVEAMLTEPFQKRAKKAEFTACNVTLVEGRYRVDFQGKKVGTSAILTNMLGSVALLYTSEEDTSKEAGESVEVWLLSQF